MGAVAASASAQEIDGYATHYGESYEGAPLGCGGTYHSADPTIVAVGPAQYGLMPCGTQLSVSGPAGSIAVTRLDSCPGCSATTFDLSEAGSEAVCGVPAHTCEVTVRFR